MASEARIGEGDTVEVSVKDGAIILRPARKTYSLEDLVSKITPRNRHGETDWAKPEGAKPEGAKPEGAKPEGAKPEGKEQW